MTTPDLNKLRDLVRTGRTGQRVIAPPPGPVPTVPLTPAPPPSNLTVMEAFADWRLRSSAHVQELFETYTPKLMPAGALGGFLFGIYNALQNAQNWEQVFKFLFLGLALGALYTGLALFSLSWLLKKALEYWRVSAAVIGFFALIIVFRILAAFSG